MSNQVIVVGASFEFEEVVKAATADSHVQLVFAKDVAEAKRLMLKQAPVLILSSVELDGSPKAGVSFCNQLKGHPQFGAIPLILFGSHLSAETVREAAQSGALGFLNIPISPDTLKHRLSLFLKKDANASMAASLGAQPQPVKQETIVAKSPIEQAPVPAVASIFDAEISEVDPDIARRLEIAKSLLEKVLTSLRSSDLLHVIEDDEVPKVVLEMTRSVCNSAMETKKGKPRY